MDEPEVVSVARGLPPNPSVPEVWLVSATCGLSVAQQTVPCAKEEMDTNLTFVSVGGQALHWLLFYFASTDLARLPIWNGSDAGHYEGRSLDFRTWGLPTESGGRRWNFVQLPAHLWNPDVWLRTFCGTGGHPHDSSWPGKGGASPDPAGCPAGCHPSLWHPFIEGGGQRENTVPEIRQVRLIFLAVQDKIKCGHLGCSAADLFF